MSLGENNTNINLSAESRKSHEMATSPILRGKSVFIKRTILIFFVVLIFLTALGLAPTGVTELNNSFFSIFIVDEKKQEKANVLVQEKNETRYTEPTRIVIPKIGTYATVGNPKSSDTETLDSALLLGAVRYPGSGDLESNKTMFIFGHSSYLPVVHNQAFKTFNKIQDLHEGDMIIISSQSKDYYYKVEKVELTTTDEGFVSIVSNDHKLILATCNSFGKKQERYIVTAGFVDSSARIN